MTLGFDDQINFFEQTALLNGCPGIRWINVPRVGSGQERTDIIIGSIAPALMDPPTAEEQEGGLYSPPAPPRIAFEGTYDEAQDFFQQTTLIENCRNCPIATWTDGLPIIVPTEEKVTEMLTGTSHDPNETIATQIGRISRGNYVEPGAPVLYTRSYTATVEKAAVCAVMAGCKPEYMPVVLAVAESGGGNTNCPGTSGSGLEPAFIVSGPISKEIGMNAGQQAMSYGNHANMSIGRTGAFMTVNFGGCITGLVRTDAGNLNKELCFAEDIDGLPPGWRSLAEESTYALPDGTEANFTEDESVIGKWSLGMSVTEIWHSPGSTRQILSGNGGGGFSRNIQDQLGIPHDTPGIYNWLMGLGPAWVKIQKVLGGKTVIMHPNMALGLYEYGFKDKVDGYEFLSSTYFVTAYEYSVMAWWDFFTDGGSRTESTSGKTYKWLAENDPDYPIPAFGSAMSNCFIVACGFNDELTWYWTSGRPQVVAIDPWR